MGNSLPTPSHLHPGFCPMAEMEGTRTSWKKWLIILVGGHLLTVACLLVLGTSWPQITQALFLFLSFVLTFSQLDKQLQPAAPGSVWL